MGLLRLYTLWLGVLSLGPLKAKSTYLNYMLNSWRFNKEYFLFAKYYFCLLQTTVDGQNPALEMPQILKFWGLKLGFRASFLQDFIHVLKEQL